MDYKVLHFDEIYHYGEMNLKKKEKGSLEGSGLSVSLCPIAWSKIAKTFGPLYKLSKKNGSFLDYYSISDTFRDTITQWGIKHKYIELKPIYQFSYYDDEMDNTYTIKCRTKKEALREATGYDLSNVDEIIDAVPTKKLIKEAYQYDTLLGGTFSVLVTIYVEKKTSLDGIYWDEIIDISRYSAPRGVIFNSKLNEWKKELIDYRNFEDLIKEEY